MARSWCIAGVVAVGLSVAICPTNPAFGAEAPDINTQAFELAPGLSDGLLTRSARRQDSGDWDRSWNLLGALHYARRPLAFVNKNGPQTLTQAVVGDLWMLDVGGSVGWGAWTFESVLPVALLTRGGGPDLMQVGQARSPSFGDLRIGARRWLFGRNFGGVGRLDGAAMIGYGAATAAQGSWLGSGGKQLDLAFLLTWGKGPWKAHANVGARLRGRNALVVQLTDPTTGKVKTDAAGEALTEEALVTGSLLRGQLAFGRTFGAENRAFGNVGAQIAVPIGDVTADQGLLELYLDGGYDLDDRGAFRLFGGVSTAVSSGVGSAAFRGIIGGRFVPGRLPSDVDGDGIDDRDDACPKKAEDMDGFEDDNGCPDPDNDGDGVLDVVDKCPLVREDIDKFEDDDGCPDPDNDKDSIPDAQDRCPNAAEDMDQFDDADGCPEDDNDGDGIKDADDMCPNLPETRNGVEDQDGCPDVKTPPLATIKGERVVLAMPVRFSFGTAVLTAQSKRLLNAVADVVAKDKSIVALRVEGHTDDNGQPADLQMLSKQRAIAVRDYLDARRVLGAGKITAEGLGGTRPVASNQTLAGRTRNRRIEILVAARKAISR